MNKFNVKNATANGKFFYVKYNSELDIDQLSSDEKKELEPDHQYIDYSSLTDDYSWSRARAYIEVDGSLYDVYDGWYIVWNDKAKFLLDPKTFEAIFG